MQRNNRTTRAHLKIVICFWMVTTVGCGFNPEPTVDLFKPLSEAAVQFFAGGYWELEVESEQLLINNQFFPPPYDRIVDRTIKSAVQSLSPESQHRIWFEISNDNKVYLHNYDLSAGTAKKTLLSDIFYILPSSPSEEPNEPSGFPSQTREYPFWVERNEVGGMILAFRRDPQSFHFGDFALETQPIFRITEYSLLGLRMSVELSLNLIADRDYPVVPPFRVLNLQQGECYSAKMTIPGLLRRTRCPQELGLPEPEITDEGLELALPINSLVERGILGKEDE